MALQPDIMYVSYYTAGSAAYDMNRKAEKPKAAPVHKRRRHMKKQRVIAVDPGAVVGILVAVCMFFALISGVQEYQDTLEQNQRMQAYMEQLQNENAALQNTTAHAQALRYAMMQCRFSAVSATSCGGTC